MAAWNLVLDPLTSLGIDILNSLPKLLGALIVLIIGYLIAWLVSCALKKVLNKIEFDKHILEKLNLKKLLAGFQLSKFLEVITKWYIFILFFLPAVELLDKFPTLANLLKSLAEKWIPSLIAAVTLALLGLVAAEYAHQKVLETKTKWSQMLADSLKTIMWIFTALLALNQLGISVALAEDTIKIVLAGIMLAVALAFGIGMKDQAAKIADNLQKRF